jgi:hypothetical protein
MSYTVANPGGPKARPGAVTAAVALLYGVAALLIISGALSVVAVSTLNFSGVGTVNGVDARTLAATTRIIMIGAALLYLLLAAGFATLAIFVGRGKNPARIVTWTVGGLVVLCCGCSYLANAIPGLNTAGMDQASRSQVERIDMGTPAWLSWTSVGLSILILLGLIVALILLALPASNDFFRKEQEVWVPPTWPGYPPPPPPSQNPPGPNPPPPSGPTPPPLGQ